MRPGVKIRNINGTPRKNKEHKWDQEQNMEHEWGHGQ